MGFLQVNDLFTIWFGGMVYLDNWDGFPMVSALVCIVAHWTKPTVSHDLKLSSSHDFTKLLHCVSFNFERILSLY